MAKNISYAQPLTMLPRNRDSQELAYQPELVVKMSDVHLEPRIKSSIDMILNEQGHAQKLAEHGLLPRNRILFKGGPGTGKSVVAHAMAHHLKWPICVCALSSLIQSYMGETGSSMAKLFETLRNGPAVLFLDEVDSVGVSRKVGGKDVGEMRRVVNTLLQLMDKHRESGGLVIAATNFPEVLDEALWRRFSLVVEFGNPDELSRSEYLKLLARRHKVKAEANGAVAVTAGMSYADIETCFQTSLRNLVLSNGDTKTVFESMPYEIEKHKRSRSVEIEVEL